MSEDTHEDVYENLWKTITSGEEWKGELYNRNKDGSYYWVRKSISEVKDVKGKVTHYICIQEDITERKQVEKALYESEEQYRRLADNMIKSFLYRHNTEGQFNYVSQSVTNVLGYSVEEFLTNYTEYLTDHPVNNAVRKHTELSIQGVKQPPYETQINHKDGTAHWLEVAEVPVRDNNGDVIAVEGNAHDITQRKNAEDALKSLAKTFSFLSGKEFFDNVVKHLSESMHMDYAFIGELMESKDRVMVVSGFGKGQLLDPFEYDIAGTPCANVIGQSLCCYPSGVQKSFPEDYMLTEMGIEGYIGAPLFDKDEESLGIMVLLDSKPIQNQQIIEDTFNIFNDRVTSELIRLKAEEELQASEMQYRAIVEDQTEFIVRWKPDGTRTFVNDAYLRYFGLSRDEAIGTSFMPLVSDKHKQIIQDKITRITPENPVEIGEHIVRKLDGSECWNMWTDRGNFDENGELIEFQSIGADITERKRVEEALYESEQKYRILFEQSADAILIIEGDRFVDCNLATVKMLGYKNKEEFLEIHPAELSPEMQGDGRNSVDKADEMMSIAFARGSHRFEWDHKRPNGEVFTVDVLLTPVPIGERKFIHCVWRDITELKQAEEELNHYQMQLRSLVHEITIAEEKERRRIAIELHDHIIQDLGLSKIKLGELIQRLSADDCLPLAQETRKLVERIIKESRSLVFDLSLPILYELGFEAAIKWLANQTEEKLNIPCKVQEAGQLTPMNKEMQVLLFKAVRELMINISKHAHANEVNIFISRVNGQIDISVQDDGVGFDADHIGLYSGEALKFGLFGIKERLKLLNGLVKISSSPGSGTNITLTAPLEIND